MIDNEKLEKAALAARRLLMRLSHCLVLDEFDAALLVEINRVEEELYDALFPDTRGAP